MKNLCTGVTSNSRTHKIQNQSIFSFNDDETKIIVHSLSGIEKQVLTLGGIGAEMCVNGHFLAVSCVPTLLKIYDLSRREAKQLVHKDMAAMLPEIGQITNISINSSGNRVAFLAEDQNGQQDGVVYIYCPDRQKVHVHEISQIDSRLTDSTHDSISTSGIRGLLPVVVSWDEKDPKDRIFMFCVREFFIIFWVF